MNYLPEVKRIIDSYAKIKQSLAVLDEQTKLLSLQKNSIEFELAQTREAEANLIDRIKVDTGEVPDFYKMVQQLDNGSIRIY
jgi:hypothetical protein